MIEEQFVCLLVTLVTANNVYTLLNFKTNHIIKSTKVIWSHTVMENQSSQKIASRRLKMTFRIQKLKEMAVRYKRNWYNYP
jgi:hypothetical protein